MRIPTSFNEITVAQFQECYFILKDPTVDNWISCLSILSGYDRKYFEDLPKGKLVKLTRQLQFLLHPDRINRKVRKYIAVNGKVYKAVYEANKLTTSQGTDLATFLKAKEGESELDSIVENAHLCLATIYLRLTWKGFVYDSANHAKIATDFKHANMGDVMGTLFFYSKVYESYMQVMADFGNQASQILTPHLQEVNKWALENIGDGKQL